jgi:tRNA(Ile)-lysidine synthetase-like protein
VTLPGRNPFKVKDALIEARVPAWTREKALVVADDEGTFGLLLPDRAWGTEPGERGCLWLEPAEPENRPTMGPN